MATYYSASVGGFLDSALFPKLPDDAVEISADEHQTLLRGQSEQKIIVADWQGKPVLAAPPSPTADQLTAAERKWRDGELGAVQWLRDRHRDEQELGRPTTLSAEQFAELLIYLQALRDWPQSRSFPDSSQRPPMPLWIADQQL